MPEAGSQHLPGSSRQTRRTSDEIKGLLLEAARELFSEKGYAVTTREIAARAGVAESLIFTRFGSKADLFEASLVASFGEFVDRYVESFDWAWPVADPPMLVNGYVRGLYRVARENRMVLRHLMGVADGGDSGLGDLAARVRAHIHEALRKIERVVALSAERNDYPLDVPICLAVTAGMIVSSAVHDDWFVTAPQSVAEDRVVTEIMAVMLDGIAHRQGGLP